MTYSQSMLSEFEAKIAQHLAGVAQSVPNVAVKGVSQSEFDKLQDQVSELMAKNAELTKQFGFRRRV